MLQLKMVPRDGNCHWVYTNSVHDAGTHRGIAILAMNNVAMKRVTGKMPVPFEETICTRI
jgi:hypothetical protein